MVPTELYNKSKRNLAVFTAFLALVLFGRVEPEECAKILGFKLAPEVIPTVLFVVVAYLLYQFVLSRLFQIDQVRNKTLVQIDFFALVALASSVLIGYLLWYLPQLFGLAYSQFLGIAVTILSALAAAYTTKVSGDMWRATRELLSLRRFSLPLRLREPGWTLIFNPNQANGSKPISFNGDGSIGEGQNSNEYRWELNNGDLVIKRQNGDLQNRFAFIPATDRFVSKDDPAAKGLKPQFIYRPMFS